MSMKLGLSSLIFSSSVSTTRWKIWKGFSVLSCRHASNSAGEPFQIFPWVFDTEEEKTREERPDFMLIAAFDECMSRVKRARKAKEYACLN